MNNCYIIGFDGLDGTGKTTLIEKLISNEPFLNKAIFTTRKKPVSPYVNKMYEIIHKFKENFEALELFVEDIAYRYSVMPKNKIIFSDRTFESARIFYEGIKELSGIEDENLEKRIADYNNKYRPIINVILLGDVPVVRKRIYENRGFFTPVESEDFLTVCAKRFNSITEDEKVLKINTNLLDKYEIFNIVLNKLKTRLDHMF